MAFGWFGKGKQDGAKSLAKAHKLVTQGRWAEALTFYEEAAAAPDQALEAQQGARACREHLVDWNLEEARALRQAGEDERCREHIELALQLAAAEADLAAKAREAREHLTPSAPDTAPKAAPQRLFEPSCGGAACATCDPPEAEEPGEELFEFYLESLTAAEREIFEPLEVAFQRGFVALQQGDLDTARPLLRAAAAAAPRLPGPAYAEGLLEAVSGDAEAALTHFSRALENAPELAPATHHSAELLCELERFAEAKGLLEAWLDGHGDDVEAWFLLARCRDLSGDPDAALKALATAEQQTEEFEPRLALARASLLRRGGDEEGAVTAYQQAATRNPNLLEALIPLGQLLIARGGADAERAAELFKHCRRIDPEHGWWHLLQVAAAYHARGWSAEARDLLETVRVELPDDDAARAAWKTIRDQINREE